MDSLGQHSPPTPAPPAAPAAEVEEDRGFSVGQDFGPPAIEDDDEGGGSAAAGESKPFKCSIREMALPRRSRKSKECRPSRLSGMRVKQARRGLTVEGGKGS